VLNFRDYYFVLYQRRPLGSHLALKWSLLILKVQAPGLVEGLSIDTVK